MARKNCGEYYQYLRGGNAIRRGVNSAFANDHELVVRLDAEESGRNTPPAYGEALGADVTPLVRRIDP
jgi:hypothetical protein